MIAAGATVNARGGMRVVRGASLLSRAVGRLLRLPDATADAEVLLTIARADGVERWRRTFNGVGFSSEQREIAPGLIAERFRALEFHFRVEPIDGATRYRQIGVCICAGPVRLALPAMLAPSVEGVERPAGPSALNVRVRVTWPPAGLILEYDGDVHIEDHA